MFDISWTQLIFTICLLVTFKFLAKFIIKPLLGVNFYAKQGFKPYYTPLTAGTLSKCKENTEKYGDAFYALKLNAKSPNYIGNACCLGDKTLLILADQTLIKSFIQQDEVKFRRCLESTGGLFTHMLKNNLSSAHGQKYKDNRNVMAKHIDFDFLVKNIPNLVYCTENFIGPKVIDWNLTSAGRKFNILYKQLNKIFTDIVSKRKEELIKDRSLYDGKTMNDYLISYVIDNPGSYSDEAIGETFVGFLLGGDDTTTNLTNFILYFMGKEEEFQEKIREEIKQKIPDIYKMTYDSLFSLVYLKAFIDETVRLYNPAQMILFREALCDTYVENVKVRKGDLVTYEMSFAAWSPNYFEKPEEFNANRWLNMDKNDKFNEPYTFLPFSAGVHNCLGQNLVRLEFRVVLAVILSKFRVKVKKDFFVKVGLNFIYSADRPVPIEFISL